MKKLIFILSLTTAGMCFANILHTKSRNIEPEFTPVITYQGTNEAVIGGEVFYPGDDRTIIVQGKKIRVKFLDGILFIHFKK